MKFPIENSIATIRENQMNARECYLNSFRKAEPRDVNVILVDISTDDANLLTLFFVKVT